MLTKIIQKNNWKETFKRFYDDNENGGSSRWKTSPDSVVMFIEGVERQTKLNFLKGLREELEGSIIDKEKYNNPNEYIPQCDNHSCTAAEAHNRSLYDTIFLLTQEIDKLEVAEATEEVLDKFGKTFSDLAEHDKK